MRARPSQEQLSNVSLESTYSNGVRPILVTVTMDEVGDLLPGMNVDGVITLEEANDVLTIPVDALMRGNQVYIKDDSVKSSRDRFQQALRQWK